MSPPSLVPDVVTTPILEAVQTCAAEQFALAGRLPCRFPITWGAGPPPADACDCECTFGQGQAWVRWVSTSLANLGAAAAGSDCADGIYEVSLELGVYRCWPVPERGPLGEAEEEKATRGMLIDAAVLRRSLLCCPALEDQQWELDQAEPMERQGGCTGTIVQARVIRSDCDCGGFSQAQPDMQQHANNLLGRAA